MLKYLQILANMRWQMRPLSLLSVKHLFWFFHFLNSIPGCRAPSPILQTSSYSSSEPNPSLLSSCLILQTRILLWAGWGLGGESRKTQCHTAGHKDSSVPGTEP